MDNMNNMNDMNDKKSKSLYLILNGNHGYDTHVLKAIVADSKAEVGKYIKSHFKLMYSIAKNMLGPCMDGDDLFEKLKDKSNDHDVDMVSLRSIFKSYSDDEILDKIKAVDYEYRGFVDVITISLDDIITINK